MNTNLTTGTGITLNVVNNISIDSTSKISGAGRGYAGESGPSRGGSARYGESGGGGGGGGFGFALISYVN